VSRVAVRTPRAGLPHRPRLLAPVLIVLAVVLVLMAVAISLYTDFLWFDSVGFTEVFSTVLRTKLLLFFLFGVLMAVAVGANVYLAYRLRPPFRPMSLEQQNLERYRLAVDPYLTPLLVLISVVLGVFAGLSASGRWQTWLLWRNRTSFGVKDPQFGKDVSFYVMTYPMLRFALGFLLATLVLGVIAAAATHYLFGGLRIQTVGEKVSPAARAHLSVLLGLIVLCKAAAYYLDRFGLVFSNRGFVQGAGYTDVNAVLPGKNILIGVAVICSVLFFANVRVRNVLLPGGALGLLVIAAVLLGGILPAFTQSARVKPNQLERERDYIARNIAATQAAYSIKTGDGGNVQVSEYGATPPPVSQVVTADTVPNARLLDPNRLDQTFQQLQQQRTYFGVTNSLDIDRYEVDGRSQDFVVAARELDQSGLPADQQNWVNKRLTYTHGNGLIAARADRVNGEGQPVFETGDDSPVSVDQPRIYFGELSPDYNVVRTKTPEIDGPGSGAAAQATFSYDGKGGVQLSGLARKLAFALKFREPNLLLSGSLTSESRILFDREPRDRVKKVAPFLEVDQDPYPAAVDGRIVWIVDAYTTSNRFPYSESSEFGEVTTDSSTGRVQPRKKVNYIRNSVKATVDAYSGEVTLYRFGDRDPVLEAWDKAFGGIVKPNDAMTKDLKAHLRYPEDLFKVQRQLLSQYHVTDPATFFSREDAWGIPADPAEALSERVATSSSAPPSASPASIASTGGAAQPPYYSILSFPGQASEQFRLSTSFVFQRRPNLAAFATVSSDPDDYGTIRVLQLPKNSTSAGPSLVANQFLTDPGVSDALFRFRRQNNSEVNFGNLLTLPLKGGLLYVQPVYVQANGDVGYPTLQQVLVAYGSDVAAAPTLAEALRSLLSGAGTPTTPVTPAPTVSPSPGATPGPTTVPPLPGDVAGLVSQANTAFLAGQAALQESPPDFAEYAKQQAVLQAALNRLTQLQRPTTTTPAPTPTR
jgi:uncharacterized membrane protein (UPF0182 family)